MGGRGRVVAMVSDISWCPHTYRSYMECVSIVLPPQKRPLTLGRSECQGCSQISVLDLALALKLGILTRAAKAINIINNNEQTPANQTLGD